MYGQSDALLLAGVFENFRNMRLKIYELHPPKYISAPGLPWQAALKKIKVKWRAICHSIYRYVKANNKYMKDYDKNKESSYIKYWDVTSLYGWAMSQKLPVNNFEWIKDTS